MKIGKKEEKYNNKNQLHSIVWWWKYTFRAQIHYQTMLKIF